jgi:hypothetical protein
VPRRSRCRSPRTPGVARLFYSVARALRGTSDALDQLEAQLHAEREQHAFVVGELEKKIAMLLRDLMQARYELAQRNMVDAFANAPSPSTMMH